MSKEGQRTKWRRNVAKNFNRLSARTLQTTDRQTDDGRTDAGRATKYSEREREFTFAKKWLISHQEIFSQEMS